MKRYATLAVFAFGALALSALWMSRAQAAPVIQSVVTSTDYTVVTIDFSEDVTKSGSTDDVELGDVTATAAGASLTAVADNGARLVLTFDGPVQPATASLTFPGTNAAGQSTGVPLEADDWTAIETALRAIDLPIAEVPIAPYLSPSDDGTARTIDDLLPAPIASSLDLPAPLTIARNADGTFTLTADGSTITTASITAAVDLTESGGLAYDLTLASTSTVDLDVSLAGSVDFATNGSATSAALTIGLDAAASTTLTGGVGIAEATMPASLALDAQVSFDLDDTTDDTSTVTTATADLDTVTIAGVGSGGADITVTGTSLLSISWPQLPSIVNEERVETGVATDNGWSSEGLQRLANVSIVELFGAPGALAGGLDSAQDLGPFAVDLPVVGGTVGESIGVGETLGAVHNTVVGAAEVALSDFSTAPLPLLSGSLCEGLAPSEFRRLEILAAIEAIRDAQGDDTYSPTDAEIATQLVAGVTVDGTRADIEAAYVADCEQIFGAVSLDLTAGTIEADVDIAEATFDFYDGQAPSINLDYAESEEIPLAVGLTGGAWTGQAGPKVDFTLGLSLASDSSYLGHGLLVRLADDGAPADESDVTTAHRIYVPADELVASSGISIEGSDIAGIAQLGFLDFELAGSVLIDPTIDVTLTDPLTGRDDGRLDLVELLDAVTVEIGGTDTVAAVADVGYAGDDVDVHFQLTNDIIGDVATLDVVGDLTGLLPGGTIEFGTDAVGGPDEVDPDTLVIAATFGDLTEIAAMGPTEVVALVADVLEQVADKAAAGSGDQRIPVVDVSLDEVAGFTSSLSDIADTIRDRAPTTITELETFVNDALADNGMGLVTLDFVPADESDSGDPELVLALDASVRAEESFPISFDLPGDGEIFTISPVDGGARLDAGVAVDFEPKVGIRFNDGLDLDEALFVRDLALRFDFVLSGNAEGVIAFGPAEAALAGNVSIGDTDLDNGGFTAALTAGGSTTVRLADLTSGNIDTDISGNVPVNASLDIEIPTPLGSITGAVGVSGTVPGAVTFEAPTLDYSAITDFFAELQPNLRTLAVGAIETSRFVARGADEVGTLSEQVPVVGEDVSAQFSQVSDVLDMVADEVEAVVDLLDSEDGDAATLLTDEINELFDDIGCTLCEVDVRWTPDGTTSILDAEGIEILLTIAGEVSTSANTEAGFGLEPLLELDVDITNASARIGFVASVGLGVDINDGFYVFPGIDPDDTDGVGTFLELYADLDLQSDITVTLGALSASADGAFIDVSGDLQVDDATGEGTAAGLKIDMPDRLRLADLVQRKRKLSDVLTPSLSADIEAQIPVAFGIELVPNNPIVLNLPVVFEWEFSDTLEPDIAEAQVAIVDASLDTQSLLGIAKDALNDFDENYNPLNQEPIKGALETKIPLVEEEIKDALLFLCSIQNPQGSECKAFTLLASISDITDALNEAGDEALPLGSFQIFPAPAAGESRYTPPDSDLVDVPDPPAPGEDPDPPTPSDTSVAGKIVEKFETVTGGYVTLPILSDLPSAVTLVLGGELGEPADLIRFEIPEDEPIVIGKSFRLNKELFDLDVGFLEGNLSVKLNGGVGLTVSGGFGFSTRAIDTGNFFDGIFLIDNGKNELGIGAELNAEVDGRFAIDVAGVDLASVKFKGGGGFSANGGIDLFDESPVLVGRGGGDGRLFFDEIAIIADAYEPPNFGFTLPSEFCMFQLRTAASWNLSFSGKAKVLGVTVFNESFNEGGTIWDFTLPCTLKPRIARVEDRQLILHAGPYADDRFDGEGDIAESFRVSVSGSDALVEWLGAGDKPSLRFPLTSFDTIIAEMGDESDSVEIDDTIVQPVFGRGGAGGDTIDGGGGDDDLGGGSGGDTITGGPGNDDISGGAGADDLNGEGGDDEIDGGTGNDTVEIEDGFGVDDVTDSGDVTDVDTLDLSSVTTGLVGRTSFGDATIETGAHEVRYLSADFERVLGGTAADEFTFKDQEPDGFAIDGGGADDDVTFIAGRRDRTVTVTDTGGTSGDRVTVLGTATADEFLLRATSTALDQTATDGFVARLSGGVVDRYDYDSSIDDLVVDGAVGADVFTLDDNAAATNIVGGPGADTVQVGQIYGLADCEPNGSKEATCVDSTDDDSSRNASVGVAPGDTFATRVITRGHLSNGVTNPLVIDGGTEDDTITIFANGASVEANGGLGNDNFVARAFIVAASVQLNGEGGIDDFQYVVNDQIDIDGGAGVDTFSIIGTEADDGFILDVDDAGFPTIDVCELDDVTGLPDPDGTCAIGANVEAVETFAVAGLEGDDVFWIRATTANSFVELSGGDDSDTFLIGDGTLDAIAGPVAALGDQSGAIPGIPDPVVLPNEDDAPAFEPGATGGTDRGDLLQVDASAATDALTGTVTATAIRGLGMADGPFTIGTGDDTIDVAEVLAHEDLEYIEITTGDGNDDVTIEGTHVGAADCDTVGCPLTLRTGAGADDVDVHAISGATTVETGAGDDDVTVGRPVTGGDTLDDVDAALVIDGGGDADSLALDDTADGATRLDVDPNLITQAGLSADGVQHLAVETVLVELGEFDDVVNVRGTAADAATGTTIDGNGGDDRTYVSSAAAFDVAPAPATDFLGGDVDAVAGPLTIDGGTSDGNLLYVSDRDAFAGDTAVTYDGATLAGLAPASISHQVTGAFGGGITVWTSELDDTIDITGSDRSTVVGTRTLTTFNTGDGVDTVDVTLTDGVDGAFVLNAEEGDDMVDGSGSTLDLVMFGGLGGDDITTGAGDDVVFGDLGTAATLDGGTVTGNGGPGDATDGGTQPLDQLASDPSGGGVDTIAAGAGDDIVVGGTDGDTIDGNDDADALIGGHLAAGASDGGDDIDGGAGEDLIAGDNAHVDDDGIVTLFDVATTAAPAPAGTGAGDVIDGGPDADRIFGQQGDDDISGSTGDDLVEGNDGDDTISGGDDQDDIVGGGSALDGVIDDDRTWTAGGVGLLDGSDTIDGDGGADVVLGDNGRIVRNELTLSDLFGDQNPAFDDVVVRDARVTQGLDPDGTFGADLLRGGDGPDELHGQQDTVRTTLGGHVIAGDELLGDAGSDVLVGDMGAVVTVLEDGSRTQTIDDNTPFLSATLHVAGTLTREVTLFAQHDGDHVDDGDGSDAAQFGAEGDDVLLGGADADAIHGGAGDDLANGGAGNDAVFGGDGDDGLWGGPDDDELFGGHDEDSLDVAPRDFTTRTRGRNSTTLGPDPDIWFEIAPSFDALAGLDVTYGGWNSDEAQADEKANGPQPGDRLVDWLGAYNTYLGCSGGNGAGTFLRNASPDMRDYFRALAEGRGAVDSSTTGTSGYRELGIVEIADGPANAGPGIGDNRHVACP